MVNYSDAIKRAWKYSTNLKRDSTISVFLIIAFAIAVTPLFFIYKTITLGALNFVTMIQFFAWFFVSLIIGVLVFVYSILLFTHNYANQKSLRKSANFALSNYPKFLAVLIVSGLITFLLSAVPFIGFILTIVATLAFFFVYQEVGVNNSKFSNSLRNSYHIFLENKLDTLITIILTAVIAFFIVLVFAIPLIIVGLLVLASAIATGAFMQAFVSNLGLFAVTGVILLIGAAFAILFTHSIKTDVYMQLKKKRHK